MRHTEHARARTGPARWRRTAATLSVLALTAAACGGGDDGGDGDEDGAAPEEGAVATDVGITEEPCPDAIDADKGCIYLGVLSDLTVGPFAGLGPVIVEGQQAFWTRVNEEGGIGDAYEVDISEYTRDNEYNPQTQAQLYDEIEPEILALAQTLGTPPTEAIIDDMDADDVIGIPASWWSGWNFEDSDNGVILESGYSYCIESQIGLDWSNENEGEIGTVQAVGYPGDYGGDAAAGAEAWAEANGAEYLGFVETGPNALVGSQDAAVGQVVVRWRRPRHPGRRSGRGGRDRRRRRGRRVRGSLPRLGPDLEPGADGLAGRAGARGRVHPRRPVGGLHRDLRRARRDAGGPRRRREPADQRRLHLRLDLVVPDVVAARGRVRVRRPDPRGACVRRRTG